MVVDKTLLDKVSEQAMDSPRLRMNYNFHQSLDEKCHRFLNAVEPGSEVPIHRHPTKDETFVILRGKVRVTTHSPARGQVPDIRLRYRNHRLSTKIRMASIKEIFQTE